MFNSNIDRDSGLEIKHLSHRAKVALVELYETYREKLHFTDFVFLPLERVLREAPQGVRAKAEGHLPGRPRDHDPRSHGSGAMSELQAY